MIAAGQSVCPGYRFPVEVLLEDGSVGFHSVDEDIRFDATLGGIRDVKPILEGGMLATESASRICEGASELVVSEKGLKSLGVEPRAGIYYLSVLGDDPTIVLEAQIPAVKRVLAKANMPIHDIEL